VAASANAADVDGAVCPDIAFDISCAAAGAEGAAVACVLELPAAGGSQAEIPQAIIRIAIVRCAVNRAEKISFFIFMMFCSVLNMIVEAAKRDGNPPSTSRRSVVAITGLTGRARTPCERAVYPTQFPEFKEIGSLEFLSLRYVTDIAR
jgi:hypothetical protein